MGSSGISDENLSNCSLSTSTSTLRRSLRPFGNVLKKLRAFEPQAVTVLSSCLGWGGQDLWYYTVSLSPMIGIAFSPKVE